MSELTKWRKIRAGAEVELKGQLWHAQQVFAKAIRAAAIKNEGAK